MTGEKDTTRRLSKVKDAIDSAPATLALLGAITMMPIVFFAGVFAHLIRGKDYVPPDLHQRYMGNGLSSVNIGESKNIITYNSDIKDKLKEHGLEKVIICTSKPEARPYKDITVLGVGDLVSGDSNGWEASVAPFTKKEAGILKPIIAKCLWFYYWHLTKKEKKF